MDPVNLQVMFILFFATLIRSTFGFGEALVAVPLLALLIPVEVAAPVVTLISIAVAAIVIVQDRQEVHFRSAGWLLFSTLFGIPLGLLLLTMAPETVVKTCLGCVIILFALYSLASKGQYKLTTDKWAWPFGFVAGILGGAYGMNGPPLVIYGGLRRWSPRHFRATLQGYFLPASILVMAGYWWTGLWTPEVNHYFLMSLPVTIIAIFLGRFINRRLSSGRFLIYVHIGLILTGLLLLGQVLVV